VSDDFGVPEVTNGVGHQHMEWLRATFRDLSLRAQVLDALVQAAASGSNWEQAWNAAVRVAATPRPELPPLRLNDVEAQRLIDAAKAGPPT
jgi:hypothetical protein